MFDTFICYLRYIYPLFREITNRTKEDLVGKLNEFEIEDCLKTCNNLNELSYDYKMVLKMIDNINNKRIGKYLKDLLERYLELYVYMYCFSLYNEFSLKKERGGS